MPNDILLNDLNTALSASEHAKSIIERAYYSNSMPLTFKKVTFSLISAALSFVISNLKIIKSNYTDSLNSKEDA